MPAITATATAVMVLTNVGLQFFNNWRGTKNSEELRKKQQEFQEAAQDRNHDRMMQLLREGQALQEQMESQMHEDRIKNISQDFDELIKRIFLADALKDWPLRVLPMVMKNQSIGSFRANSNENIALHVILTPSNCPQFNASVFPHIEQGLEAFCNQHWNTLSSHPIVFYSGAWKTGTAPDNNEISLLQSSLPNLPVLMITPYFKHNGGNLVFKINMWGAGDNQQVEIQPTEQEFSYYNVYAPNMNYGKEIASTTIEEFIPYLQCMIGYLADVYFWSAHGVAPILPSLLTMGAINTDGMKYLIASSEKNYSLLLNQVEQDNNSKIFRESDLLNLLFSISPLLEQNKQDEKLRDIIHSYCIDTLKLPSQYVDYITNCLKNEKLEKPADFQLPTEIVPLLFLLHKKNLISKQLFSSLCSCVCIYNPLLVYNISELMSVIESLYTHSVIRFRFVNANIVLCFTSSMKMDGMYSDCFGALLYKSEHKYNGCEFSWNVENKKFFQERPSSDIDSIISKNLIANLNIESIKSYQLFCKAMADLGEKMATDYKEIISRIDTKDLSYKNILSWVKSNYEIGDSLIVLTFAHAEYQYVIGLLEKNDQWNFNKYIGAKGFRIDTSIKEKMNNNSILIQKIK